MILYLVATKGNSFEKIKKNVSGAAGIDNWSANIYIFVSTLQTIELY